jgi:hypothetical protein|uniref:Flagellar protein FlgJ N-terminal domain-containing protein n=1 Tax=Mesoaciditoga lauensis TaxID=1495039 RepID=A0A7V3VS40_9BACT
MISPITPINLSNIEALPRKEAISTVATQFVSTLLSQIFEQMEKGVSDSGLIPQQMGESWYKAWLMDAYAEGATKADLGSLIKTVENQLTGGTYGTLPNRN